MQIHLSVYGVIRWIIIHDNSVGLYQAALNILRRCSCDSTSSLDVWVVYPPRQSKQCFPLFFFLLPLRVWQLLSMHLFSFSQRETKKLSFSHFLLLSLRKMCMHCLFLSACCLLDIWVGEARLANTRKLINRLRSVLKPESRITYSGEKFNIHANVK